MTLKLINEKIKQLKDFVLNFIRNVVEPETWDEFLQSKDLNNGNFLIVDEDLPIVRDIKAVLNMLTSVERATEKLVGKTALEEIIESSLGTYSFPILFLISNAKKIEMIEDYFDFKQNLKIYMSTTSILTQYLTSLKDTIFLILPQFLDKMMELSKLCTTENLEKAADFFIEQVITLEKYQENYLQEKKATAAAKKEGGTKKQETRDDVFTSFININDSYLRSIFKEKYPIHFKPQEKKDSTEIKSDSKTENKTENKSVTVMDYYPEHKDDTDVMKHIKLLLNVIIGIKKVLDDYQSYQQADMISSIAWIATFASDLRKACASLQEFDYQAIIAEKSGPYTNMIKYYLNILNDLLENLACIADQFENEFRLKEGTLLKPVDLLVQRHNQITSELSINPEVANQFENEFGLKEGAVSKLVVDLLVQRHGQMMPKNEEKMNIDFKSSQPDYVKQKNTYYKSRQHSRHTYIRELDTQINDLSQFLFYRNHALMDIPYYAIHSMQAYINKYSDIICLENTKLEKYNSYLTEALYVKRGLQSFISSQVEAIANSYGWTIHSELMATLNTRLQYLQKQKIFIINKFNRAEKYYQDHPYHYLNQTEMAEFGTQKVVLKALNKHVDDLNIEKEQFLTIAKQTRDPLLLVEDKNKQTDSKSKPLDDKDKMLDQINQRLANKIKLKSREYSIFSEAAKKCEEAKTYKPLREILKKEDCLAPKSVILIDEVIEVMCNEEQKSVQLD